MGRHFMAKMRPRARGNGRLGAHEGGRDLRNSVVLPHNRLALPLTAPSVHAIGRERDSYVARVARYIRIQWASPGSKALKNERDRKTASLTLAVERDATMAVGRPYGDAIDGAVLVGRQRITCDLASLPSRPYHVCTPPPRVRTSKTAADLTQLTVSSRACGRRLGPAAHE